MKIQVKMPLSLPSEEVKIKISYNTYEKATYDQYLVAAILKETSDSRVINSYIDDITGKGSLNNHFKMMVEKNKHLDSNAINRILESSLFPIIKIDNSNHFKYYPLFNISIYNKRIYEGNLSEYSEEELLKLMNIDFEVIDLSFDKFSSDDKKDIYDVVFESDIIKVKIFDSYNIISEDDFYKIYKNESLNLELYQGQIHNNISGDGWLLLSNMVLNSLSNNNLCFYDDEGNYNSINIEYIKNVEIASMSGIYFYKENKITYSRENRSVCEKAIDIAIRYNFINEIKTKVLIKILDAISDLEVQKVINYVLIRKESKELAQRGFHLIQSGLEKGWDIKTLDSIKPYAYDLNPLYKICNELEYSDEEISRIDNDLLSQDDALRKQKYLKNIKKIKDEISKKMGYIATSGIREKCKEQKNNKDVQNFYKKLNKLLAHSKDDLEKLSDEKLMKRKDEVDQLFDLYLKFREKFGMDKQ